MTDGGPGDDGTFHEMIANGLRSGHIPSTRFLGEMPSFRAAFVKKESPGVRLGRSTARVVELRSGGSVSARVDRRFLQEGQVGSRRDPSDGQVSFVVDFVIPSLRRGAGAFIATVTGYPYLNPLSSLLLTIPLHLTMSSVVLAARRAPALCKVNSGTSLRDLAERVNSGINFGDLAEKVNSGTSLGDLAERVNPGTNSRDLAEKVNSSTNPEDLAEKVNSSTNPEDLAEKVNFGANPRDLAERLVS
ncbi:hypothetical protein BHE74_00040404, partial [Ensete ventricosum]